jgi:trans-aconitate methyltransferase
VTLLGAKEVVAINDWHADTPVPPSITFLHSKFEKAILPDEKFDLIFAIAVLEHINNPIIFANTLVKKLKKGGHAFIQGTPMWTSSVGHHLYVMDGKYNFTDSTNILDDWYHLTYPTQDDFKVYLSEKNVPLDDIPHIWDYVYNSPNISRYSPSEIISIFKSTKGITVNAERQYDEIKPTNK